MQIAVILISFLGLLSAGAAPSPELVKDIWTTHNSNGSNPGSLTALGNTVFFSASDPTHGTELWKSDGTAEGTVLVKDIRPGALGSNNGFIYDFTVVGGTLYFAADDGIRGSQLWKSDGTEAGTVLVKEIQSESGNSQPGELTAVGGMLFFRAFESTTHGHELWKSDGTEAGTVLVKDIVPGIEGSVPLHLTNVGGTLYFSAFVSPGRRGLWKSDGTEAGTILVKDVLNPDSLTAVGNTLYFTIRDAGGQPNLWKSDGTEAGTVLVTNIKIDPDSFATVGNTLYFSAYDPAYGQELWKSDGTAEGTVLVKDISPGADSSNPASLTAVGGILYFHAFNLTSGSELWKSDGTEAGTVLVKDINVPFNSSPNHLTAVGDTLYFRAFDSANGDGLWKSDGTAAGTVLVKDLNPEGLVSELNHLTAVGNTLFFVPNQPATGNELWKSDGTAAGTVLVKDIVKTGNGNPFYYTAVRDTLYFLASDPINGDALWKSDGTESGTVLVKDHVETESIVSLPFLTAVGGTLWFLVDGLGLELWKTDGTAEGTALVKEDPLVGSPVAVGDTHYFMSEDPVNGYELWKSDGSEFGTLVKDIYPGAASSYPTDLTAVGDTLYFRTADPAYVLWNKLWKSDGTEAGTVLVKDFGPEATVTDIKNPTAIGGLFYFSIEREFTSNWELWKSDGTEAGTVLVKEITPGTAETSIRRLSQFTAVGSTLYFAAYEASNPTYGRVELWKSDGTAAGTVPIKQIVAETNPYYFFNLAAVGDTLYFVAEDPAYGSELWKTDGSTAGTVLVKDIHAGIRSADPENLTAMGGVLYFSAYDPVHGHELWKSDGTAAGTVLIKNITGDSGSSLPKNLRVVGNKLYFSAQTEQAGRELYVYDPNGNAEPTVTLIGLTSATIEASAAGYTDPGATATDVADGSLTPVMTSNVNTSLPGTYQVTWTATDKGGLAGIATRTVIVQDTTPPTMEGNFSPLRIVTGTALPDYTAQAVVSDIVGVTSVTQSPLPGTPTNIGTVQVTITARDAANNEANVTFSVRVKAPDLVSTLLYSKGGAVPNAGTDPRIENGAVWSTLSVPAISDSGAVAFLGKWRSTPQTEAGIFVDGTLVMKTGEAVPGAGTNGLPANATFKSFRDPVVDSVGHVAFFAAINGAGVRSSNDTVLIGNGGTGFPRLIAREGDIAPDSGGAKFKEFANASVQGNGATLFTAKLQHGTGNPKVSAANDNGVWWLPSGGAAVSKLVREGDPGFQTGEKIRSILALEALSGSPGHGRGLIGDDRALFGLRLTGGSAPRQALVLADVGKLTEVTATGDVLGGTILPTAVWKTMNLPSSSDDGGNIATMGSLSADIGGVINATAKGIFVSADTGTTWNPLVRTGEIVPNFGDRVIFTGFRDPVNSSTDSGVAFLATTKGPGVRGSNNDTLWWKADGGQLKLVAREGDEPASGPSGAKWKSFTSLALPGGGAGPIFVAALVPGAGSVTSASDCGLYAIDSEGTLLELIRENQPLEDKVVKKFSVLKALSGSQGVARSFNANYEIVVHVTFTDGGSAIVKVEVP